MSTLDQRLYAWLFESDDRKFELAFRRYFSVAFPALVRRLGKLSRWDPSELEEIAQDALLRFFEKVGRERRQAAEKAKESLADVQPLALGPLHTRHVTSWTTDVAGFIAASMEFQPPGAESSDLAWKDLIRELSEQIPILQSRGRLLLSPIQVHLGWHVDWAEQMDESANSPSDVRSREGDLQMRFAETLLQESENQTVKATVAERSLPGVAPFVAGTVSVVRLLPRLRVPTNGYLFEIATTVYLDECKKRGRRKRGGTPWTSVLDAPLTRVELPSHYPLDGMDFEPTGDRREHDGGMWAGIATEGGYAVSAVEPTLQYEDQEYFEKFSMYLRAPLDAAMEAYASAHARGGGAVERRRLESLSDKHSRLMAVVSLIGEGYTQEKAAELLGLTRNQVKYILEQVQDAYTRFGAASVESTSRITPAGAHSNAD